MQVRVVNNITKEYPDMFKVLIYKQPQYYVYDDTLKRDKHEVSEDYQPKITSLSRTKTLIRDIIICNNFEYFVTFTFDPDKVDRFSYSACLGKISRWIHNQKENSKDFAYLIVPERHKSGAWHFHALISHFKGSMRDSKHKSATGRPIYNITSYRSGFSTAVPIDDKYSVGNYVAKYITKDFIKMFNRKRFTCSRNLIRPIKSVNSPVFELSLPLSRSKIADYGDRELYNISTDF